MHFLSFPCMLHVIPHLNVPDLVSPTVLGESTNSWPTLHAIFVRMQHFCKHYTWCHENMTCFSKGVRQWLIQGP
jgi:hypothetical protein